ncbi:indolepyruvate ferredoxin oxidoreductase family protein [Nisaea acidiphila]|uniref:Indolepyruvate ferredoxin oxidoreductase family protein n=1 Tax=Nisaea acidiphila TaxID=1862145 RepID=A0A9J7AM05_9PROT|nr:indolepyruvate ferredoxin oxidoreductase family protein [Nisaea acidiphila]UUX48504.1 indolepyruvate ferredoxin oxidoreductase family protein [Nisaea acidiphila]
MTALKTVALDDKYALDRGRVYMTGIQALVRLPMAQRQRDAAAGLNTACFISGYRGSPLGTYDQQLWRAREFVKKNHIHFQPGLNEDLAATAVWGSQQTELYPGAKYDGVFSIWYGKGPGVDRSGDAFKHANFCGTSKHGGVLAIAGDDHVAKSSTIPHQSEYAFMDACIPMLHPAGVQDVLDYGLYGIAMSRFSGCWAGLKATAENMDSSASIEIDPMALEIGTPSGFEMPEGGLNVRWPDPWLEQEARLHDFKLPAVLAFARANRLDRVMLASPKPRIGIVTVGKSYLDVRQALDDLGISDREAAELGLAVYKVAMPWPLEPEGLKQFAAGLDELIVIEEKRPLIEDQAKAILYELNGRGPKIIGKKDETGTVIMPTNGELSAGKIARVLARRLLGLHDHTRLRERLDFLDGHKKDAVKPATDFQRIPYFCSGCPHNTSTKLPDGSLSFAGIGCHFLASWMPERETKTFTQMGAEGTPWIGMAPFTEHKHMFVNLGDGTYTHSGLLAIRAAVAAKVNITYKILYNDAVAMTGGQPAEGAFSVLEIANQVAAERVAALRIVTDEPDKYPLGTHWPDFATLHHRDELDAVQKELRETEGVTIILYDQTCATEKRRRRKRGLMPEPAKRLYINQQVCEGCGDCGVQSNCVSLTPVETEFGRKRAIDQSSCNKDYSCAKGFCPSFVNVIGGRVRKKTGTQPAARQTDIFPVLPEPEIPALKEPYNILISGIGGTGVVTIGALLGMAAHLEDKGVTVLDQIGLAQKNGSVISHVRLAQQPDELHAVRIAAGSADLMLACDMITAAGAEGLSKVSLGETTAIVNTQATMNGAFTQNPDLQFPAETVKSALKTACGENSTHFLDANRIATALLGDSIASNLFVLGYAYQLGLIPLSGAAIERAVELNGVAVEFNKKAFLWGRRAAHDLGAVEKAAAPVTEPPRHLDLSKSVDEEIERRAAELTAYQNAAYADRYLSLVAKVRAAEERSMPGREELTEAVARYAYKLMAYKDEYEVARLYTDPAFRQQLDEQFEGNFKLEVNLAPPLLAQKDPETGRLKKRAYGPWIFTAFKLLTAFKGLRGTAFDPFGRTGERKTERRLIEEYFTDMETVAAALSPDNHAAAVALAKVPEHIRGYGHVKERHLKDAARRRAEALEAFRQPEPSRSAAE